MARGMWIPPTEDENVDDGRAVTVPPGSQRTVRTLRRHFGWGATGPAPPNGRRSFAGEDYEVEVPQHCGATMTRAVVHCSTGGLAAVDLWFRPAARTAGDVQDHRSL